VCDNLINQVLDTQHWGEFSLDSLFTFKKGKLLTKDDMFEGQTNFIAAINSNNGIRQRINIEPMFRPNCITVNNNGSIGEAFYQSSPFCASADVCVLYPKDWLMNRYIALFIVTVIKANRFKFSYGRKWTMEKMKRSNIKLPITSHGSPDWAFMEKYIKSLGAKPIKTSIKAKISPLKPMHDWREFLLGDLFTFYKGKRLTKDDMIEGQTNYLGAISDNNGIRQLIDIEPMFQPNCITVNYNGSVGEAFYQSRPFWASDDVNVLYPKDWVMSKYIALFITTVIKANRYRFSYGRKWTMEKMKQSVIKLPATSDGTPDWEYMERYIKSLPYSDRI